MPQDIGRIDLSGDGEERTWRITIDFPAEAAEGEYTIETHREIVVKNASGDIIQRIRDENTASRIAPASKFKARQRFKSQEANSKSPNALSNLRNTIDQVVVDKKGSAQGQEVDASQPGNGQSGGG